MSTRRKLVAALRALIPNYSMESQWDTLRHLRNWVSQCRGSDADAEEVQRQISDYVDHWLGERTGEVDDENNPVRGLWDKTALEEFSRTYREGQIHFLLEGCQQLARIPAKVTDAAFNALEREFAKRIRTEDALQVLEKQVRAFFKSLDDRTRYIIIALERLRSLSGFSRVDCFDEIGNELFNDAAFLEVKSENFANDPQLACMVKAARLGEVLYALEEEREYSRTSLQGLI